MGQPCTLLDPPGTSGHGSSRSQDIPPSSRREAAGVRLRTRAAPKLQPEHTHEFRPGDIALEEELLEQLLAWMDESVTADAGKW